LSRDSHVFDATAAQYDLWYESPLGQAADDIEKRLMAEAAAPLMAQDTLDLGAGTGQLSLYLAAQGARVTGLDISGKMLARARDKAVQANLACLFLEADAAALPFPDGSFDVVTCLTALEFFPYPADALAEAWRVLRPGGRLVVGTIHRDSAWGEAYRAMAGEGDPIFRHARLFGRDELASLLGASRPSLSEGLYLGPDARPATLAEALRQDDEARAQGAPPGFVVARWVKPGGRHQVGGDSADWLPSVPVPSGDGPL